MIEQVSCLTDEYKFEGCSVPESSAENYFHTSDPKLHEVCNQLNSSGNWITWLIDVLGENYITSIMLYQICQKWNLMPKSVMDEMLMANLIQEWDLQFGKYWWFNTKAINERIKIQKVYNTIKKIDTNCFNIKQNFNYA